MTELPTHSYCLVALLKGMIVLSETYNFDEISVEILYSIFIGGKFNDLIKCYIELIFTLKHKNVFSSVLSAGVKNYKKYYLFIKRANLECI